MFPFVTDGLLQLLFFRLPDHLTAIVSRLNSILKLIGIKDFLRNIERHRSTGRQFQELVM